MVVGTSTLNCRPAELQYQNIQSLWNRVASARVLATKTALEIRIWSLTECRGKLKWFYGLWTSPSHWLRMKEESGSRIHRKVALLSERRTSIQQGDAGYLLLAGESIGLNLLLRTSKCYVENLKYQICLHSECHWVVHNVLTGPRVKRRCLLITFDYEVGDRDGRKPWFFMFPSIAR